MYIRYLAVGVLYSFLVGCADTHQLIILSGDTDVKLDVEGTVYVSVPEDGAYYDKDYRGSGQKTTRIIQSAFARHIRNINAGREYEKYEVAINSARNNGAMYLIFPTILHWEDRATEWSSIPDKVEVKIEIVNVETSKTLSSVFIKGKSGIGTFGGDLPQYLLPVPIEKYVSSLY